MAEMVAGPGPYSQRTDMGNTGGVLNPNNPNYGEVADIQNLKSAAPLSGTGAGAGTGAAPQAGVDLSQITPLGAPSGMPGEHVTTGTQQFQPPGSPRDADIADLKALPPALISTLLYQASQPGASPTFQKYVREVYSNR